MHAKNEVANIQSLLSWLFLGSMIKLQFPEFENIFFFLKKKKFIANLSHLFEKQLR